MGRPTAGESQIHDGSARLLVSLLLAAIGTLLPYALHAQIVYLGIGSSISYGWYDCYNGYDPNCATPPEPNGEPPALYNWGYTNRLNRLLTNATVENWGLGGRTTESLLTAIDNPPPDDDQYTDPILERGSDGDYMIIMGGANDINQRPSRQISIETMVANLDEVARRACLRGIESVQTTMVPRCPIGDVADYDPGNVRTAELATAILASAANKRRLVIDPFSDFGGQDPNCNRAHSQTLYTDKITINGEFKDPVGHPNAKGFDRIGNLFHAAITAAPAPVVPVSPTATVATPTPTFTWQRVPGATRYKLAVWPAGGAPVFEQESWTRVLCRCDLPMTCSLILPATSPLAVGAHTWEVTAWNPNFGYGPGVTQGFAVDLKRLTVAKAGVGSGMVTSAPAGISCGTDCEEDYAPGTTVELAAEPDYGSQFASWGGDPDCGDGEVVLTTDRACMPSFVLCTVDSQVTLPGMSVDDPQFFQACNRLTAAAADLSVQAGGDLTVRAGNVVVLTNGVSVVAGALTVEIGPPRP